MRSDISGERDGSKRNPIVSEIFDPPLSYFCFPPSFLSRGRLDIWDISAVLQEGLLRGDENSPEKWDRRVEPSRPHRTVPNAGVLQTLEASIAIYQYANSVRLEALHLYEERGIFLRVSAQVRLDKVCLFVLESLP